MDVSTRLFVGNLPENYNENLLREAFSSYGNLTNFDVKCKQTGEEKKVFAFITLAASNYKVESCIKRFSNEDFCGHRLYVTRARESFLDRLQREREQSQSKSNAKAIVYESNDKTNPLGETLKIHKRKFNEEQAVEARPNKKFAKYEEIPSYSDGNVQGNNSFNDKKNNDLHKNKSDEKRLESIKRKRQEFNEKKRIIKTGLLCIDKQINKKVIFSDTEDVGQNENGFQDSNNTKALRQKVDLFDNDESDGETNFEIKEHYEGTKGQRILELQSKYKSDKRFMLDERFIDNEKSGDEHESGEGQEVELGQADEKTKQLHILQDVLGVTLISKKSEAKPKNKLKQGMLRFNPAQPEHARFLAPVAEKQEPAKKLKNKKRKNKEEIIKEETHPPEPIEKVEVSKETFYKVSDSLKESLLQPTEFSLRSLFARDTHEEETPSTPCLGMEDRERSKDVIPDKNKNEKKLKNPMDPGEKNPFIYDSSDSENEEEGGGNNKVAETPEKGAPGTAEPKTVWREKLFFTHSDDRLKDGLLFFSKVGGTGHKDRRELKSLMKKRIYNKDRKNNMFQNKIGGRKKTMKKSFRKKFKN